MTLLSKKKVTQDSASYYKIQIPKKKKKKKKEIVRLFQRLKNWLIENTKDTEQEIDVTQLTLLFEIIFKIYTFTEQMSLSFVFIRFISYDDIMKTPLLLVIEVW